MSDLLRQLREQARSEGDYLRSLVAELQANAQLTGRYVSPAVLGMAKLVLELNDIGAGKKFYGAGSSGKVRLFTRKREPRQIKRKVEGATLCGAMTRKGTPCRCLPVEGKSRCKYHGGASTGPRTEEGRARIAESNRRRAQKNKSM